MTPEESLVRFLKKLLTISATAHSFPTTVSPCKWQAIGFESLALMEGGGLNKTTVVSLIVVFGLLVVPRALQRFRLPAPLTCFALGIIVSLFFKQLASNSVLAAGATLGIAALFLFAGLEVDVVEIRGQLPQLIGHLGVRSVFLALAVWIAVHYFKIQWQFASLLALALFTPSTGFILDTLPHSGLDEDERKEVSIRAIAREILALLVLFVVSQSSSMQHLAISSLALVLLIAFTPFLFLALGKFVVPYAPGSEFSLLVMVGIICAAISKGLGLHVLLGAFVAGLVAGLLRKRMATLAPPENLHAVRLFASFFVPFYFFHEGLRIPTGALVWKALLYGIGFSILVLPLRIAKNWLVCRYTCHRSSTSGLRVGVALTPTLIFTLVIARILDEAFAINDALYGGLLVYTAMSTILPSFVLPLLTQRERSAASMQPLAVAPTD
jgi:Kef-type K+ transport system membrane component KefB